jgi:hypothetical protein
MTNQTYEQEHAHIINNVLELELATDKAKLLNFDSGTGTEYTAYVKLNVSEEIYIVFNLPTNSNKLFMTVTDGDPESIAYLISELENADKSKGFKVRDTVRFNNDYLIKNDKVGVLLLPAAVSNILSDLGNFNSLSDEAYELLLCVFISAEDYSFQKNFGNDGLMDKFARENRDLIAIS